MKKISWVLALAFPVAIVSCKKTAVNEESIATETPEMRGAATTGNGAPSGAHYTLNIIGVKDKTADMSGSGNVIFVKLDGQSKINLTEGDFAVLDKNGTDANGASFQLPAPDADCDGETEYSVFARALGKPGGSATVTNCATYDGEVICETDTEEILSVTRTAGQSKFTNVTKKLLYIYVDITDDGVVNPVRYPIFDDRLQDYYWQYDNKGLKLLQLRFYQIPTSVESDCQTAN